MEDSEKVVKHLEMIQGVISRLGHDSFLVKGWSMSILVAGVILLMKSDVQFSWIALTLLVPVVVFWGLDVYFLRQERLFRAVYNYVREQNSTDFSMDTEMFKDNPECRILKVMCALTLAAFYGIEAALVAGVFSTIHCGCGG